MSNVIAFDPAARAAANDQYKKFPEGVYVSLPEGFNAVIRERAVACGTSETEFVRRIIATGLESAGATLPGDVDALSVLMHFPHKKRDRMSWFADQSA